MSLKKGYTTGVHASFAFYSALCALIFTNKKSISFTVKMENDDLDVTKGAKIWVEAAFFKEDLTLNPFPHKPQIIKNLSNRLYLFAGKGVGVVTKKGLKIPPSYPAINPSPLKAMENIFKNLTKNRTNLFIYSAIGVIEGEMIAKETANEKVGVIGGISILGESGFVKPVSAKAYVESIKEEIKVAYFYKKRAVFTIGESAYKKALLKYDKIEIIEIGNYVYDSLKMAKEIKIEKFVLVTSIGKLTKIAQGKKNTHNRFGGIDFERLKEKFPIKEDVVTVKRFIEILGPKRDEFIKYITLQAKKRIYEWIGKDIEIEVLY